jgi:hypothetical protein
MKRHSELTIDDPLSLALTPERESEIEAMSDEESYALMLRAWLTNPGGHFRLRVLKHQLESFGLTEFLPMPGDSKTYVVFYVPKPLPYLEKIIELTRLVDFELTEPCDGGRTIEHYEALRAGGERQQRIEMFDALRWTRAMVTERGSEKQGERARAAGVVHDAFTARHLRRPTNEEMSEWMISEEGEADLKTLGVLFERPSEHRLVIDVTEACVDGCIGRDRARIKEMQRVWIKDAPGARAQIFDAFERLGLCNRQEQKDGTTLWAFRVTPVTQWLVEWLRRNVEMLDPRTFKFEDAIHLPLIVGARMSLSFPGLISAVPLWRRDFTLADDTERKKLRRCIFSDGGLSSNFPIHFFDRLLPNSPTFAISLDEYDEKRNRGRNVWLPSTAGSGSELPILPFEGLVGFLMRLIDSAKDWQDNLQSTLPGYRERIAHIVLKPTEGGLNLAMSAATIRNLTSFGARAGETLLKEFDLDSHRWRRFLVAMARMEETLDEVAKAYEGVPGGPEAFADFLARYASEPDQYKQDASILAVMLRRGRELASDGANWRIQPTIRNGHIPKPETDLRISPKP